MWILVPENEQLKYSYVKMHAILNIIWTIFIGGVMPNKLFLNISIEKHGINSLISMNCTTTLPPLGYAAEFQRNGRTIAIIGYNNKDCYIRQKPCSIQECVCSPYYYMLNFNVSVMTQFNNFSCQMRFDGINGHQTIYKTINFKDQDIIEENERIVMINQTNDTKEIEETVTINDLGILYPLVVGIVPLLIIVLVVIFVRKDHCVSKKSALRETSSNDMELTTVTSGNVRDLDKLCSAVNNYFNNQKKQDISMNDSNTTESTKPQSPMRRRLYTDHCDSKKSALRETPSNDMAPTTVTSGNARDLDKLCSADNNYFNNQKKQDLSMNDSDTTESTKQQSRMRRLWDTDKSASNGKKKGKSYSLWNEYICKDDSSVTQMHDFGEHHRFTEELLKMNSVPRSETNASNERKKDRFSFFYQKSYNEDDSRVTSMLDLGEHHRVPENEKIPDKDTITKSAASYRQITSLDKYLQTNAKQSRPVLWNGYKSLQQIKDIKKQTYMHSAVGKGLNEEELMPML